MITVRIEDQGQVTHLQAARGTRLSELLRIHTPFDLPCGGKGICLRCRVRAEGALSAPTELERTRLTAVELRQGWRFACMSRAEGDVTIHPTPSAYARIQADGEMPDFAVEPLYRRCGMAVDIGTTTVCVRLYGPGGALLGQTAGKNTQTRYGADVISRIEHALGGGGRELAACIRADITRMTASLLQQANIAAAAVDAFVITGNTTMLYLLTTHNPEPLSHAPFRADRLFGEQLAAADLFPDLPLSLEATVYLPRCMTAFVGADFTTAVLAGGVCHGSKTALLVDIGTNGEMGLWHDGRLTVCSTAAGPAFEGVGLSCGVYGVRGAVDHVWLADAGLAISTIGGGPPVGICGSGIVDALRVMLECGAMDQSGAMDADFPIADGVSVTPRDVRQVQLAKSAIRAGMETLLHTAGLGWGDVDALLIAGGFGSYLDIDSAAAIGLVPRALLGRTRVLGNAALTGASMLLLRAPLVEEARRQAEQACPVALDTNPFFMEQYVERMLFE